MVLTKPVTPVTIQDWILIADAMKLVNKTDGTIRYHVAKKKLASKVMKVDYGMGRRDKTFVSRSQIMQFYGIATTTDSQSNENSVDSDEEWLTVEQAARLLDRKEMVVYQYGYHGKLVSNRFPVEGCKHKFRRLFLRSSVEKLMKEFSESRVHPAVTNRKLNKVASHRMPPNGKSVNLALAA